MKNNRQGQISIQYIGGFFIFVSVLVYVTFSVITASFEYKQKLEENSLREEAWVFSNYIVGDISTKEYIDAEKVESYLGNCVELDANNHADVKRVFNVKDERSFNLIISKNPVPLTTTKIGNTFSGDLEIEGSGCIFTVSKSVPANDFDRVELDCDNEGIREEQDVSTISGVKYTIDKIGTLGQFVILRNNAVSCGLRIPEEGRTVISVERFLPYKDQSKYHIGKITLNYW